MRHLVLKSISHPQYQGIIEGMLREKNLLSLLRVHLAPYQCAAFGDDDPEEVLLNAAFGSFSADDFLEFLPKGGLDTLLRYLESVLPWRAMDYVVQDEWDSVFSDGQPPLTISLAYEEQPPLDFSRLVPTVTA